MNEYDIDFSLALINRTGAFHVGRDMIAGAGNHVARVRFWRLFSKTPPKPELLRKLVGRAMLAELGYAPAADAPSPWPRAERPMVFLDPLYVRRTPLRGSDVVLCHDVGPITHRDLFDPRTTAWYAHAYEKIRAVRPHMAFVSAATQREFNRLFDAPYPSQTVIPLAVRRPMVDGAAQAPAGVQTPYLLMVGAYERRKNHARALAAFRETGLAAQGYSFVLAGPRGLDADKIAADAAETPNVHSLGMVSDSELRWLYKNAAGFVLPSLLEGFGVPALEAAAYGLPALLSGGGALEEAVDGAGVFCDPLAVASIAAGMRALVSLSGKAKAEMVARGRRRAEELTLATFQARWRALLASPAAASKASSDQTESSGRVPML